MTTTTETYESLLEGGAAIMSLATLRLSIVKALSQRTQSGPWRRPGFSAHSVPATPADLILDSPGPRVL